MKTVFVGLSGGVDSATSAYLLKKEGYNVVGAFIKGWEPDFLPCTGKEDRLEAMRAAAHLGIPFVTYDLEDAYKREVVDYFVSEYKAGRTPNPDVLCNRAIKFGAFWERAKADGADGIATGHYAQIERKEGAYALKMSADAEKDQTYFLWTLNQDDLSHTLFPVGNLRKEEVRALASEAKLPNAGRKDSQGLCFLGHVDMHAFLKRYIPSKKGPVKDRTGRTLGEHDGVWFYTLGQRHGVTAEGADTERARMYVVGKNIAENTLIVSDSPEPESPDTVFHLTNENWVSGIRPSQVLARFRYRQPLKPAKISQTGVKFETPQLIASGQSVVAYDAEGRTLGGGIIG